MKTWIVIFSIGVILLFSGLFFTYGKEVKTDFITAWNNFTKDIKEFFNPSKNVENETEDKTETALTIDTIDSQILSIENL